MNLKSYSEQKLDSMFSRGPFQTTLSSKSIMYGKFSGNVLGIAVPIDRYLV